ncbi:hypothetical protein P7K49_002105, partial [Saguinus oedipus]
PGSLDPKPVPHLRPAGGRPQCGAPACELPRGALSLRPLLQAVWPQAEGSEVDLV